MFVCIYIYCHAPVPFGRCPVVLGPCLRTSDARECDKLIVIIIIISSSSSR